MDGRIIAGRFIQYRAKGVNGKVSTHLAEDPLSGERVVLKVFSEDEPLVLEYLKGMNVLGDHGCRGMALPLEGGMMEEEPGYYQAYPEIPGPTLEEYLALNPSMEGGEVERLMRELGETLSDLHEAGFVHLFLSPRNVFYSPGRPVLCKDPALTYEHYSFFMQELQGFDYSFFSPGLMDGGDGRPEEDHYSLGRIAAYVMDRVEWVGEASSRRALLERAARLTGGEEHPAREEAAPLDQSAPLTLPEGPGLTREAAKASVLFRIDEVGPDASDGAPGAEAVVPVISLEGLSLDEDPARRNAAGAAGRRRKQGRPVRLTALVLITACALAVLAYGLQAGPEGDSPAPGPASGTGLDEGDSAQPRQEELEPAPVAALEDDGTAAHASGAAAGTEGAYTAGGTEKGDEVQGGGAPAAAAAEAPPANRRPVASFSASPSEGASPLQVYLDASSSYDPDGGILSYQWSCGGSGVAVWRVFESSVIPARVSITLTVTDGGGATDSTTRVITLY